MTGPSGSARLTAEQERLWAAFVAAYTATSCRRVVNRFLRALLGTPR